MRRAALVIGLVAVCADAAAGPANTAKAKRVAGRVVSKSSVCGGGAAIRQEDIDRLPPPQPLAGREFLVVAGSRISAVKPAARFTSRPDGTFVVRLPAGRWCFFEANRRPENDDPEPLVVPPGPDIDPRCLAEAKRRCDLELVVRTDAKEIKDAEISFVAPCSSPWSQPCYRGPMPP